MRVVDDLAMVERQLGQFVFGEPSYVVTVLEARGLGLADERPVHDGYHGQSAMGPGRASKGVQLFEVSRVQVCGRFEGRVGGLFQRPVGAQVAAGMVITGRQHSRYRRFSPISLTQYWLSTSRTLSHPEAFSAAKTPRPFSLEGNAINQPFTAPAVIPDTRYFWKHPAGLQTGSSSLPPAPCAGILQCRR